MSGLITLRPGIVFLTTDTLPCHEIGIGTSQPRWLDWLMHVDANLIFGGHLD